MTTFTSYSQVFEAVRKNRVTEIDAILQLQIASEAQLAILKALRDLPEEFSAVKLSSLDHKDQREEGIAPSVEDSKKIMSDWAKRQKKRMDDQPKEDEPEHGEHQDDEERRVWLVVRVLNNYSILVGKRAAHTSNPFSLGLPGGHPYVGESSIDAVLREGQEETGMVFNPKELTDLGVYRHKGVNHHFFRVDAPNVHAVRTDLMLAESTEEMDSFHFYTASKLVLIANTDKKAVHKSVRYLIKHMGFAA